MYDDYDLDYTYSNDYADLDEDTYAELGTSDLDEDYAEMGKIIKILHIAIMHDRI